MKSLILVLGVAVGVAACSSPDPTHMAFVENAQTVESIFRAFEAEDSVAFWGAFAEQAVWRGTGVSAPSTLSRKTMETAYENYWKEFDYHIAYDLEFQPGIHPDTQLPNGSVNGMFLWEVSKEQPDGTRRSVHLWIYESFDFNQEGEIVFTQVFSDLASAYRLLREN